MKTKIYLLLVSFSILTFVSCDNNSQLEVPEPEHTLTLIHFTEPSYVNHLIVNDYENAESFLLMRGNQCDSEYLKNTSGQEWRYEFESLNNRIPYIKLVDDWYLVDWSWYMYPLNGQTLLSEVTWDNYNGEYTFDKSIPHITGNIYERKDIVIKDLIVYSCPDGKYPTFMYDSKDAHSGEESTEEVNEYVYYSRILTYPYLEENGNCPCNRVEELDALWDVFRQQLDKLIKNGDLNSLRSATDEEMKQLLGNYY